jgi:hypothetical protein
MVPTCDIRRQCEILTLHTVPPIWMVISRLRRGVGGNARRLRARSSGWPD